MGRNWAIAVGINEYYNLQPLNYAVQDAESIQDFFLNEAGFEQVYYFSDHSPRIETPKGPIRSLPTFANLKRFLRERFQQPFLETGDNFWFFFAGHGELQEGHDYLMPVDADPGNLEETALRISDITAYLRNCGADNVVLLLDACRSQGRRSGLGFGVETQPGMVTVYSCSPREASYEIEDLRHGAFTYALLEGLRLQGMQNCATVERLDQYLRYQVPELNQRYGKPGQTPYTAVEPISKNRLILLPQRATLQDVLTLKNDALEAEAEAALDLAEQLWIRVLAASSADRQAIKALQRIALQRASQPPSTGSGSTTTVATSRSATASVQQDAEQATPILGGRTLEFEVVTVDAQGSITDRQRRSTEYRRENLGNGVVLDLVAIPAGEFRMGSPQGEEGRDWYQSFDAKLTNVEGPQRKVAVSAFWIGKYPVTQAQWRVVAALPKIKTDLKPDPSNFKGDNRPVEQVSWHEAMEFCARLSQKTGRQYRLPSEAEWEYACRAGTTTPFHFGETITTDLANYRGTDWEYQGKTFSGNYGQGSHGSYRRETTEVGSFKVANAFGLYDMHGNVWEWCQDVWHDSYTGAPDDGSAWVEGGNQNWRVLRGGSWGLNPRYCRSAYRYFSNPDNHNKFIGFRVVCEAPRTL
ncbi:MAG: SUMF1/EgtB/PvdO family nonheme iron enzyme [Leptolyngbyaceae cyanobacterium]